MLRQWIRVIKNVSGVLTDLSLPLANGTSTAMALTAGQDSLLIGQHFPFANFFVETGVGSTSGSELDLSYWDGSAWRSGLDLLDGTDTSVGGTFAQTGVIQFTPNRNSGWVLTSDTSEGDAPTELQTTTLYDLFWLKLEPTVTLSGTTTIKRIAYAFTKHEYLVQLDPEINEYLVPWGGAGKLNWNEQILIASEQVASDMKARGFVWHRNQIILLEEVYLLASYRTLELIYSMLGPSFAHKLKWAQDEYKKASNVKRWSFDKDQNARMDRYEQGMTMGKLVR